MTLSDHTPTDIKLKKETQVLSLIYDSGNVCQLSAEFLRVNSPSAEVKGHHPSQAILQTGKKNVKITKIEPVGHYAVKLHFDDGHDSGLYSWEYLYVIGHNQETLWKDYLYALEISNSSRE